LRCASGPGWQESLAAHADDTLIITGHPVLASDGTHVLLAQRCVSMVQQREKKAARHQPLRTEDNGTDA